MVLTFVIFLTFLLSGLSGIGSTPTVNISSSGVQNVTYGENLTLTCQVDQDVVLGYVLFRRNGSDTLRITDTDSACNYRKENSVDTYAYNVACYVNQMRFTMVRQKVNYSDHNTIWNCQMYSANGTNGTCKPNPCNSSTVMVSISGPPFVQLLPNVSVYNVTEGTSIFNFTCVVTDSNPWPTSYDWFYNGSVIQGQISSSYMIPSIQRSNNGSYQCRASNAYGNGTSKVLELAVQYGPVVTLADSKEIEEGETFQMICGVSANPAPGVMWYKSGMNVSLSANLTIPSISRHHEGNYTCTANNVLYPTREPSANKTASKTLNITIVYGPGNSTIIHTVPLSSVYEVAVNQTVGDIVCNATCKPRCSYNWYKNGTTINNTDTLSLGVVQRSSEGNYTCEAYNTILQNITKRSAVSIYVRVKYAPVVQVRSGYHADLFIVKLGQRDVVLSCTLIDTYPQPSSFTWTQNGTEVQRDRRSNYTITEVTRETNGTWGCTGNNTYGTPVEDYMDILVQYGPFVNITENKTLNEGESVTVECTVDANPPAFDVFWSKDDAIFNKNTTELRFDRVSRHDSGTYRCIAVNKINPSGKNEEWLNGTQCFYLVVKFDETSSVGPVVGGVLAAIVVLALLGVALFLIKRRGYSLRSCIKLGAISKPRKNTGSNSYFSSTEIISSPSQGTDPIYANDTQHLEASGGEYEGLQINREKATSYLQLKDVKVDNNGDTNASFRQSDGDAYDNQHVYMNYEGQTDSLHHPEIQTDGEQELYANQQKRT